ncbi:TPA: hypothetical protein SHY07_005221 [Escherichia coli]|uniref:hypothetical protein n=1 Tax=Escherichia coli TaxID=562 RepID=UPI001302CCE4|nr:hypothetical protein [Escherichia coli]EFA5471261.1 hypothetical protein [Escherichia coli]EFJ2737749.1 hypothetical protein [Escherichia coli]EFK4234978.1 hypothetical protein [Escherichia coli]EID2634159.1 hypothetical protein [Escherichia coli]EKS1146524.1 hypothetical protein [Escherichia coli]
MGCNKKSNKFLLFVSCMLLSFVAYSQDSSNPQFSDYLVPVSNGPFEKNIHFNKEQENYSQHWKNAVQEELKKPVNFAGHFRIYTAFGGHGKECLRDNWVCGWVIDKLSGEVVATLPSDNNGSYNYADVSDNGTPVGLPFEIDTYKNSSMIAITGQSISVSKSDSPVCKTTLFNFNNNKYVKLIESPDGCNNQ